MAGFIAAPIARVRLAFQGWLIARRRDDAVQIFTLVKTAQSPERELGVQMASTKQKTAARKNIKKAASAAKRKHTIAHLPKSVRTALGKKGASAAKKQR